MTPFSRLRLGSEQYPALTGVRAFGATVIFFDHFPLWPGSHITLNVMAFFFVLSGFLIVRIYYEQADLTRPWLGKYFANRFGRIYPVYFLLLTVTICFYHHVSSAVILKNYTLTHALFHGTELIIQPSWSLTVEECFYALAPMFMVLAKRYNFFAPFALGCMLLLVALFISTLGVAFLGTPSFVLSTTFFGHFVEFFAGVYLALAILRLEKSEAGPSSGRTFTTAGLIGVSVLVAAMTIEYGQAPLNGRAIILINNFLIPFPIALLYLGFIRERTSLSRLLSTNLAGLLGRSSYAFYLLHTLVINGISIPWLLPLVGSRTACVLLTLVITWTASVLLFAWYEEPVNLFIRRTLRSNDRSVGMLATLFRARR